MATYTWLLQGALAWSTLATCGPHLALRGSPSLAPPTIDGRGSVLALPSAGEVRGALLRDGWPVWLVRHRDGSASVLAAVTTHARSAATLFAGRATLVRWLPHARRFLAGDVLYDEHGRVLGYATDSDCSDDCPGVGEPAPEERDLDRFTATVARDRVIVAALVRAAAPEPVSTWVDWDHEPHTAHELPLAGDDAMPAAPLAIADALRRPLGSYAIVAATLVQSTAESPRLCPDAPSCASCDASSPRALGVPAVAIDRPAVHAESGTILVRRDAEGLAVIAMTRIGACGGR